MATAATTPQSAREIGTIRTSVAMLGTHMAAATLARAPTQTVHSRNERGKDTHHHGRSPANSAPTRKRLPTITSAMATPRAYSSLTRRRNTNNTKAAAVSTAPLSAGGSAVPSDMIGAIGSRGGWRIRSAGPGSPLKASAETG